MAKYGLALGYLTCIVCAILFFKRKVEAHFELIRSFDDTLRKFESVFDLANSKSLQQTMVALHVSLPFFFPNQSGSHTLEQKTLARRIVQQLILFYLSVVIAILILFLG